MRQLTRALGAALGVVILGSIIALIPQKNVSGAGGAPVVVTNTPLPVNLTNTPLPVFGNVNATQSGAWNVGGKGGWLHTRPLDGNHKTCLTQIGLLMEGLTPD